MKELLRKQRWTARLLIALFVPLLLLSSMHHHAAAVNDETVCVECAHHTPHNGHLSAQATVIHDCVLCQFLSVVYLTTSVVVLLSLTPTHVTNPTERAAFGQLCTVGSISSRAPPFSFC